MNEDYLAYWGMSKPPFSLTPDPDMLYLSSQHAECLMRLKYAVFSHKGGALLVSDNAGNGKTSLLVRLQKDLNEYYSGRVKVVFIDHPTLSPIEMIGEIGRQLGTELETSEKIRALNALRDRLYSFYNENIKVIVIVDEGQMLKDRPDILGELRILLNFCVADAFLLTFIFSGQKPLDGILREMPEFWQRLPVRYFLKNLIFNDTKALVKFRLKQVGASEDIFKEESFDGIYNFSQGCPRVICSIADLCLVIGFAKGVRRIGFVEVSTACRDMESSGDGFHYYAYLQSQQFDLFGSTDAPTVAPEAAKKATPKREDTPRPARRLSPAAAPAADVVRTIVCPACGAENKREARFCTACQVPLFQRCPACLTLMETALTTCPACQAAIEPARQTQIEKFRREFKAHDILEGNASIWIEAQHIPVEDDETVLIVFPRGNFLSPGPTVIRSAAATRLAGKSCDVILTDRRLLFTLKNEMVIADLNRIESCRITDTGGSLFNRKPFLFIQSPSGPVKLMLPYGPKKSRKILNKLASFIETRMLR
ncbi:AAA family ATPase [Candidatus Latescibacterota bacterium]